jgi:hypothetical protein
MEKNTGKSIDFDTLKKVIEQANEEKGKIIADSSKSKENKAEELAALSKKIRNEFVKFKVYLNIDAYTEGKATTINPDEIRTRRESDDDVEIRCDFWGPSNDLLYFKSPYRIVVVSWEAYVLWGEYQEYKLGECSCLGGHKQNEEFTDYSEMAKTNKNFVDFCTKLLLNRDCSDDDKRNIMANNLCVLQHNFFPALALNGETKSNRSLIEKWSKIFVPILRGLLEFYEPTIVLGHRDFLGFVSEVNSGIFNQALDGTENFKSKHFDQSLIGRKIEIAERVRTGRNKCGAIVDSKSTIWIGYLHFSRNGWSGDKGDNIIDWIKSHLNFGDNEITSEA